jgi:nucleotide-binding universal stress UspA family protein
VFNSVVIAADVDGGRVRAVPVGASLADLGRLPVKLLTVVSQASGSDDPALAQMAELGVRDVLRVVHHDVATAIVENARSRQDVVLVMATNAKSLVSQQLRGSVSAAVLQQLRHPVLLVGPAAPEPPRLGSPTLVVCTDRSQDSSAALPVVESWQRTFGGSTPWIVEVMPTAAWPAGTTDDAADHEHIDALAAVLADHGIDAATRVLHGGDPVEWLLEFGATVDDAVFVATSTRWAGSRSHWYSTTRRLVARSPRPVLVVPADLPGY